ncbi:helix-turn-helix domain-containing protein [Streptomyces pinistramenti]|uniref:helix-turn-helix domain-containing protein n=1 Tax=Streptomyces pinistramenti TaxID=2884812 RepID=UPI001D070418|nr:helix-turn-helix transcriptional regulator [Streptomyces pinistramenti]MCB5908327.1 helix-turn-helix transcriptional regulator [Streptomyces pinistramenti]
MLHREVEIGSFLKARRAALDPAGLGLPSGLNRRRVRGLRREEVAQLAAISVDYYTRIEQGRAHAISASVLDAIARALRLTGGEVTYLRNVAALDRRAADGPAGGCAPAAGPGQTVRPEVRQLLDAMAGTVPATVIGRGLDILAWNSLGARVGFDLDGLAPGRRNSALLVFLDPAARALHPDWDRIAEETVGNLRAESGRHPEDPRICAVVGELLERSGDFRRVWEAQSVSECLRGTKRIVHPRVGELHVTFETFRLTTDDDQILVTYSAPRGSVTESRLRELAELPVPDVVATAGLEPVA